MDEWNYLLRWKRQAEWAQGAKLPFGPLKFKTSTRYQMDLSSMCLDSDYDPQWRGLNWRSRFESY
jgi:hypothetical protein